MSLEESMRKIASNNQKTRAEFSELSARVIRHTLTGTPDEANGIDEYLARQGTGASGEPLPEAIEDQQLGGANGGGEPAGELPAAIEEPGGGI